MLVENMIEFAKQDDDIGFEYLEEHYEPTIKGNFYG